MLWVLIIVIVIATCIALSCAFSMLVFNLYCIFIAPGNVKAYIAAISSEPLLPNESAHTTSASRRAPSQSGGKILV